MMKSLLVIVLVITAACSSAQNPPIAKEQLMEPAELAMSLTANKDLPVIVCVGPGASIPHSINVGMVNDDAGIDSLKKALRGLPKNSKVVVYCGCCPFEHCPNARPALAVLKSMNFTNYFLLNLPSNIKKDWIEKGYPTTN